MKIPCRQQNTKSQLFASCHHGPGPQFLTLSLPHNLLSPCGFCSVYYSALFFIMRTLTFQGCYLPQFVTLNLSCALMFRKLRQLGPVVVVLEKEAVCWRGIFEQNKDPKWQPFTQACHLLGPLPGHCLPWKWSSTHLCPLKRQNEKEDTSSHVLLVFSPLARH